MTYAIGDIHGCHVALKTLLVELNPRAEDLLICLGDYIDRGSDSRGVVETLLQLKSTHNLIHLIGNHEVFLGKALSSDSDREFFLGDLVGGTPTLHSYGKSLTDIPKEHLQFLLEDSRLYYETDTHIFVHGGLLPDKPLSEQSIETLTFTRFPLDTPHYSGKTMVCGHTIQGEFPKKSGTHGICIDTGAGKGGWVTVLEVETGICHQANEEGEYRKLDVNMEVIGGADHP